MDSAGSDGLGGGFGGDTPAAVLADLASVLDRAQALSGWDLYPHAAGGKTQPENGIPLCGRHNRWKQKGYTTGRDPDARRWRTYRPDGSAIE